MTTGDVAKQESVSIRTVVRWIEREKNPLKAKRVDNGHYRIERSDLEKFNR